MVINEQPRTCEHCASVFSILPQQRELLTRFQVPDPMLCPQCRLRRRYAMRNERVLYQRECDLTGKPIVTIFHPDSPYTVYSQEAWWSDTWDQLQYGSDVDFTRPILDQLKDIQIKQPRMALLGKDSENSEYTNHSAHNKDCYIGFSLDNCEKVFYGYMSWDSSYLVDCSYMYENSELCYQCFYCHRCYGCGYLTLGRGCTDVWFSFDMSGCEKCFLSWNLRNKKYCFMNEQLTESEYDKRVADYKTMTHQQQQELIAEWQENIKHNAIHQASQQVNVSASTGNFITNCNAVSEGYYISDCENSAYLMQGVDMKDCLDCCNVAPAEFSYEMTGVINTNHAKFVNYSYDNDFVEYVDHVFNSRYMFACVGLNKQKYCILNKQYTEPEYKRLREKVIAYMSAKGGSASGGKTTGEYGEFFPLSYSPFAYNETVANDLYPLSKKKAEALGAMWNDTLDKPMADIQGIPANELPNTIAEVNTSILKETILCAQTGNPFKILEDELHIYQKLGIPLPRFHPEVRFQERIKQRSAPKLFERQCSKCAKNLVSTFSEDRPEHVYCDACYKAMMY